MDHESKARLRLESMLHDASVEPTDLPLSLLRTITYDFSDDQKIGSGGFAIVYKGLLQSGTVVAVKKLAQTVNIDETYFDREVTSMISVKHKNIVRFLGYCADTQKKISESHNGKVVMAEVRERLLCFEYMPNGGLNGYITDASGGLPWRTRYQIIKGICEGLHYLHQKKIVHLDLKPANILLDNNMVPKIADFGLARCFREEQSRTITSKLVGSLGYLAPEFLSGEITFKLDIYSLGVTLIEILTGQKGRYTAINIDNVLQSWSSRFGKSQGDTDLEHVRVCTEIALECLDTKPEKRPNTQRILETLNEMDNRCGFVETEGTSSALHVLQSWSSRFGKSQGDTDLEHVRVCTKIDLECLDTKLEKRPNTQHILETLNEMENKSGFVETEGTSSALHVLQSCSSRFGKSQGDTDLEHVRVCTEIDLECLDTKPEKRPNTQRILETLNEMDNKCGFVETEGTSSALHVSPELIQSLSINLGKLHLASEFTCLATSDLGSVEWIDVHPTKTWILVAHTEGCVCIWNYQNQEKLMEKRVANWSKEASLQQRLIFSAKFIAREQCFATGVGDKVGLVRVYSYTTKARVKEFEAHGGEPVSSLAVHSTEPFLLTASYNDKWIKVWNWAQGWMCTQEFDVHEQGVRSLTFDQRNANMYASASRDDVKVWHINSSDPISKMDPFLKKISKMDMACIHYCDFFRVSHRHFLVTFSTLKQCAYIWDLQTKKRVHELANICGVACHPTLPILATVNIRKFRGPRVCLWDVRTYRVLKTVSLKDSPIRGMAFTSTKEFTRLVVPCQRGISIVEIKLPEC